MEDIAKCTKDAISVFSDDLIVGNQDTITLFGTAYQIKLRDYSQIVSKFFLHDNDNNLEVEIKNIISAIDTSKSAIKNETKHSLSFNKQIVENYKNIMMNIERVNSLFKTQQVQLLKETKLLEKLSLNMLNTIKSLEEYISISQKTLSDRPGSNKSNLTLDQQNWFNSDNENVNLWYSRLEKRIHDLKISHTIALQNKAQLQLLYSNKLMLMDKISNVISNTIPAWQNQTTMLMGCNTLEQQNNIKDFFKFNLFNQKQTLDFSCINDVNNELINMLEETISLEHTDSTLTKTIKKSLTNPERM